MSVIDELSIARKTFDDMAYENELGTDAYLTGRVGLTLILEHIRNSDLTEQQVDKILGLAHEWNRWDKENYDTSIEELW